MIVAEEDLVEIEELARTVYENRRVNSPERYALVDLVNEYAALQRKVNELETYLLSTKFHSPDDYVNVRDVLNRLA